MDLNAKRLECKANLYQKEAKEEEYRTLLTLLVASRQNSIERKVRVNFDRSPAIYNCVTLKSQAQVQGHSGGQQLSAGATST